jgi:hypothetical protein
MLAFRTLLVVMFGVLLVYTGMVISQEGLNLFQVFFSDMAKMKWPGQFNLDFMFMLSLSGLWVAWRHRFTALGLSLGLLAFFLGASFLCVYLLILIHQTGGSVRSVLLGSNDI